MELPINVLVILAAATMVLLAIFFIINIIQSGESTTLQAEERNRACSNWSMGGCKSSSSYLDNVKKAFGCSGEAECRTKCSAMKYCLI